MNQNQSLIDRRVINELRTELSNELWVLVQELIDTFLDETPKRIHTLQEALKVQDQIRAEYWAHILYSSCGDVGATQLAEQCRLIHRHCESGHLQQIEPLAKELIPTFRATREEMMEQRQIAMIA